MATNTITQEEYLEKWNDFSWEIDGALMAFHSLLGASDWQANLMSQLGKPPVQLSPHALALSVFSNAIVTEFFISACRIRETTNSKMSLPKMVSYSVSIFTLDAAFVISMQDLLDKTEPTFEKLKKARGCSVAHLHEGENPFQILKQNGVSRDLIQVYLEQCLTLYVMLGKPIGKDFPTDQTRQEAANAAVSAAYYQLWPL
jgi:hypothetical protein